MPLVRVEQDERPSDGWLARMERHSSRRALHTKRAYRHRLAHVNATDRATDAARNFTS